MSASIVRSPRPTNVAGYRDSSPRLSSPLNPSPGSFSPPLLTGHTPHNSPINEMSDTLSPLRERLDSGLTISPRTSPSIARPRASSFSRSPERSPVMGSIPLQQHRVHVRHSSPGSSPLAQGIPFPSSSPISSSPFADPTQPIPQNQRLLSSPNNSRLGSPSPVHSTHSQFHTHPVCSPHPTSSHVHPCQRSHMQIIPSPSQYTRTQSLIQQSFGSPYAVQDTTSLAGDVRSRRVSLGAELCPTQSIRSSPVLSGHSSVQDASTAVKGDSTPLNEAPIRWWGGQSGWADDWDIVPHRSHGTRDPYAGPIRGQPDGIEFVQPRRGGGLGAFLDEEIRASFGGMGSIEDGFPEPLMPGLLHAPVGTNTSYRMDGVPASHAVLMPMDLGGAKSRIYRNGGYGEVEIGPPPVGGGFAMQKMPDDSTHHSSCHVHLRGNADGSGTGGSEHELGHEKRGRRFSDASTRSSTSYVSCLSGPSQSQSRSLLVSSSQSHTSTCLSLSSLGIGIEEAEREKLRSKSIWKRGTVKRTNKGLVNDSNGHNEEVGQGCRHSQLVCADGPEAERVGGVNAGDIVELIGVDSKPLVTQTRDKDTVKHGSIFSRAGSRRGDVLDEQRDGYNMAEKYVSLAVTSILPVATITSLSPFGEALIKARNSAKYVGHELAPLFKDTLSVSTQILALVPLPGLEEAAKALLYVWNACQKVDTNRLSCLRLAERCATLLYSVRCEVCEAGVETALGLAEPVEKLCGALVQIRTFLETQLHRPFLKRYVRREEIARELQACNEAITDAGSRFGTSVQIRTYHEVCSAMKESKRWFAQEAQALIQLDHEMMQRHYAMMYEPQALTWQEGLPGNALGLAADDVPPNASECGSDPLLPSPVFRLPPSSTNNLMSTKLAAISGLASSTVSTACYSDRTDSTVPVTPTPTRATFVTEDTKVKATMTTPVHLTCPMQALAQVHRAQDAVDAAADEAALRGTLAGALNAQNDVEMVRCLQVARGEISEAAETLRRMLGAAEDVGRGGSECAALGGGEDDTDKRHSELDKKFMQSGIEAMTRLTSVAAEQPQGKHTKLGDSSAPELPSWTITRYEVIRTCKIGMGFFSDVYLGHWQRLDVVIRVLAHSVSREAFVRYVELWNKLDHPNVLPLCGASSAVGDKPWFFVSKFCGRGGLAVSLERAKTEGVTRTGNKARLDPLKSIYEIAKGMAYLHECGVLHGDLRAANVLVDENGQCVVSDFGQCEIRSEVYRSCGQPAPRRVRWRAPEMLMGDNQPTRATDMYAFAMCCVEILGMGDVPWGALDDKTIQELVLDKDERPPIPALSEYPEACNVIKNLLDLCWIREQDRRPTFASVLSALEEVWRPEEYSNSQNCRASTPMVNVGFAPLASTESSPGDEHYETASENMMTEVEEERADCMIDIPLTSPGPIPENTNAVRSVIHVNLGEHMEAINIPTRQPTCIPSRETDMPTPSLTDASNVNMKREEVYRRIVRSNHSFHSSLTLPLWSPTRVEPGAVGYLSRPKGEFITLFNAMHPLQNDEGRLRHLPSMHGYGKFEVQKREEGKRTVAQRGLDAISGFLTFKTRSDRSHLERIARQYAFPLAQGTPSANLCVEKTVHRYIDCLEAPKTWFKQHADVILEVLTPFYPIRKEDLILVTGVLDAPDWAVYVSDDHSDGRIQFNVLSGREKGEPWGMYTMERTVRGGTHGPARSVEVSHATLASKVSCIMPSGHDSDTVMLAALRFEGEMQTPTVM